MIVFHNISCRLHSLVVGTTTISIRFYWCSAGNLIALSLPIVGINLTYRPPPPPLPTAGERFWPREKYEPLVVGTLVVWRPGQRAASLDINTL